MIFNQNDIVLHTSDKKAIGIVRDNTVEWWNSTTDSFITGPWNILQYQRYMRPFTGTLGHLPRFRAKLKEYGVLFPGTVYNKGDSPLVRKIKELDYKWELAMQKKESFFLTSRAPTVDQKTTLPPTQMDTPTVSAVRPILPHSAHWRGFIEDYVDIIPNF